MHGSDRPYVGGKRGLDLAEGVMLTRQKRTNPLARLIHEIKRHGCAQEEREMRNEQFQQ
jgi:hypothetical protein